MDISAIVVILVLTVLFLGAIIWMELHSRTNTVKEARQQREGNSD